MAKLTQPPSLALRWQADIGDHVIALAWSPDGAALAAASISGPVTIFDAATGAVRYALKGHGFGTAALAWQPGGKILASAGQDGKARLWNTADGVESAALDAGSAWVERLAWHPRGERLVTAAGKSLRLWNERGDLVRAYPHELNGIADVGWGPKGKEFASAGYGGIAFWSPDSDQPRARFPWKGSILALAWSPDGEFIAGGAQDASVHFWHAKDSKDLEMTGYPRKVRELAWDSTSTFLATGGGNLVTIWNCSGKGPAGSAPISCELHEEPLAALSFQHRGPVLASACADGIVALWFPGGARRVLAQARIAGGASQLAWSPNDARLAVGGETGAVSLFAV